MAEEEDLSISEELIPDDETPMKNVTPNRQAGGVRGAVPPTKTTGVEERPQPIIAGAEVSRHEFRGVGSIYARKPVAAVLQIGWREKDGAGGWKYAGSFGGSEAKGQVQCFNIMTSIPDHKETAYGREVHKRSLHPDFKTFNSMDPASCQTIRAWIMNSHVKDCYLKKLGAFAAPQGWSKPPKGWWCEGDSSVARRWLEGKFKEIICPGRMCEFQQDGSGPRGQGQWCKCHLSLIAQFRWKDIDTKSGKPLTWPEVLFQWDTQGWNNASYLDGFFKQIEEATSSLGFAPDTFPLIGLPIVLKLITKSSAAKRARFPVVAVSADGNPMAWMQSMMQLKGVARQQLAEPAALQMLPPPQMTKEDVEEAAERELNPHYRPANERQP